MSLRHSLKGGVWAKEKEHFINADTRQDLEEDIGRSNGEWRTKK